MTAREVRHPSCAPLGKKSVCVKIEVPQVLGAWTHSSVVEHSTADREVPGSNPGASFCRTHVDKMIATGIEPATA